MQFLCNICVSDCWITSKIVNPFLTTLCTIFGQKTSPIGITWPLIYFEPYKVRHYTVTEFPEFVIMLQLLLTMFSFCVEIDCNPVADSVWVIWYHLWHELVLTMVRTFWTNLRSCTHCIIILILLIVPLI